MKIDVRSPQSVYITIGSKVFYIDDSTNEEIVNIYNLEQTYCNNCGSVLGLECGEAEPDYNEDFCSKGCYEETTKILTKYKENV